MDCPNCKQGPLPESVSECPNCGQALGKGALPDTQINVSIHANDLSGKATGVNIERVIYNISSQGDPSVPEMDFQWYEPETILIPEGEFWMGRDDGEGSAKYEAPLHQVHLDEYHIGKYPVTNEQFHEFVLQSGYLVAPEMGWDGQSPPEEKRKLPVVGLTFFAALAYCEWLYEQTGRKYRLPNEAEWEKAARGDDQRSYPWGQTWEADRCNQGGEDLATVDRFAAQSPFGCSDMVGNCRQWTISLWGEKRIRPDDRYRYPWAEDARNDIGANNQIRRVVRGSSYLDSQEMCICSIRSGQAPDNAGPPGRRIGFRIVRI